MAALPDAGAGFTVCLGVVVSVGVGVGASDGPALGLGLGLAVGVAVGKTEGVGAWPLGVEAAGLTLSCTAIDGLGEALSFVSAQEAKNKEQTVMTGMILKWKVGFKTISS